MMLVPFKSHEKLWIKEIERLKKSRRRNEELISRAKNAEHNFNIVHDENEELKEFIKSIAQECINLHCDNRGAVWIGEDDWAQCEFCYTTPNSKFNIDNKLKSLENK